jgi:hypothetical protein
MAEGREVKYLVDCGRVLGVVEGGDEYGERLQVVHADVELVLQHARALVAHAGQRLPPPLDGLGAHGVEDTAGDAEREEEPEQEHPAPAHPHLEGAQVVAEGVAPQRPGQELLRQRQGQQQPHPVQAEEAQPHGGASLLRLHPASCPGHCPLAAAPPPAASAPAAVPARVIGRRRVPAQ